MKVGALIPVRLTSERLPGKALKLLSGRPVIYHLLDRVAAAEGIKDKKDIVICTTESSEDDSLVNAVTAYGCSYFRGDQDDIVKRLHDAMVAFEFDAVIQADGDDPLSSTEYMDKTLSTLLADSSLDIVTVSGLPLGCATKSFTIQASQKVQAAYLTRKNDTGFIYFFTKSGLCNSLELKCDVSEHQHPQARLTLDYAQDFELFSRIFDALYRPGATFGLELLVEFLYKNPKLLEINRSVEEEYWNRTREKAQLEFLDLSGIAHKIDL